MEPEAWTTKEDNFSVTALVHFSPGCVAMVTYAATLTSSTACRPATPKGTFWRRHTGLM